MIDYTNDFLNNVCNWGDNKNYIFSIDVDFVPDYILNDTIELLKTHKLKSTVFFTHDTGLLNVLEDNDYFEVGVHPNINAGSTQKGSNNFQKINYLAKLLNNPISNLLKSLNR